MYRLLIHLGQPKTATTSLQNNVLMRWHEEQRIHFLGCSVDGARIHKPLESILVRIRARPLTDCELKPLRSAVEAAMDPTRLNVLSDERFSGMETVGPDAPADAEAILHNLHGLFRNGELRVLVSLRSPVDFLLTAYAEGYYWRFHRVRACNTLDRFLGELLRCGAGSRAWLACFPGPWLSAVSRRFDHVRVLLYEDLAHDPTSYFAGLAACLEADPADVERAFSSRRWNTGARSPAGRLSRPLTVRERLRAMTPPLVHRAGSSVMARLPLLHRLYCRLGAIPCPRVEHRLPDADTRARLQRLLGIRDDALTRDHGINADKLARYGYLHPEHPGRRPGCRAGVGG